MDGLSVAVSVAGLVSLALQVKEVLHKYISDVKSAEEDVENLTHELDALRDVLGRLQDFFHTNIAKAREFDTTASVLANTVKSCAKSFADLDRLLKRPGRDGMSKLPGKMKWPFHKKQVENILEKLRRYNQLFQF